MTGTKMKIAAALVLLAVALFGAGIGRFTAGAADGTNPADKKLAPAAGRPGAAAAPAQPQGESVASEPDKPAAPVGPGNELVVRCPKGGYTREVPGLGSATLTFNDGRLFLDAAVRIDKMTFSVRAEADYTMNRESMVYGIITSAEMSGPGDDEMAELALIVSSVTDMPFAFRVRVEDDAITVKDVKFGPFGNPLLTEVLGGSDHKDLFVMTGYVTGKYKAHAAGDRKPPTAVERGVPPIVPRGNVPTTPVRPRRSSSVGAVGGGLLSPSCGTAPGALIGQPASDLPPR